MRRARSVVQAVSRAFSWLAGFFVLVLMLLVVMEVMARDVFETTLGGTIEISEVLLVFLVFLGIAFAQQEGAHVNTNLVTSRLPERRAALVRATGMVLASLVLFVAAWATADRGWASMQAGEARFGLRSVPVWPARLIVPVGFVLLGLESLFTAWDVWRAPETAADGDDADTSPDEVPA